MKRSLSVVVALLAAATLGSGAFVAARAAEDSGAGAQGKAPCCAEKAGAHAHDCADKKGCGDKAMSPEMAAKMAEMDKRMDELAAQMNSAKGEEKVDAMAAVLNEMLARQKAMRDKMRARHSGQCGGSEAGGETKKEGMPSEQGHAH